MTRAAHEGISDGSGPTQTDGSGRLLSLFIESDECRSAVTNSERDGKTSSYAGKGNESGTQHGCLHCHAMSIFTSAMLLLSILVKNK